MILTGSICLSQIPKNLIKKVVCKDGQTRLYLNIAIFDRREKDKFGNTHVMTCAPAKKEERDPNVNYFIADLKEFVHVNVTPSPEEIESAPAMTTEESDDLPF
jgi:hypothetical protein